MEEIKTAAFRSAVSGYNKKDVNDYIAALSKRHEEQLRAGDAQLAAVSAQAAELEAKVASMAAELAKPDAAEPLREELSQTKAMLDARAKQVDVLTAERDSLREQLAAANTKLSLFAGMETKLADYERMKAKMGEIYLEAASNAGRIKTEAEEYAAARRADVDSELAAARNAQFDRISMLLTGMTDELLAVIDTYRAKAAEIGAPALTEPAEAPVVEAAEAPAEAPASDEIAQAVDNFVTGDNA